MQGNLIQSEAGAILYDGSQVSQPPAHWFDPEYWRARNAVDSVSGGRGTALIVRHGQALAGADAPEHWVLRHYHRGGAVASLLGDRYLFTGAARTRAFREFRLMLTLHDEGYPVPRPVAARYRRSGLWYRADLITQLLPGVETLTQVARARPSQVRWEAVGACIARFHQRGVFHADLNAHNVMLSESEISLLDFDRARIRAHGKWQQSNLLRLKRSLIKEGVLPGGLEDQQPHWRALLSGYAGLPGN